MKFLETSARYATLEDAKVLLCINIERLLVNMIDVVGVGKEVIREWCVEGILVVIRIMGVVEGVAEVGLVVDRIGLHCGDWLMKSV